MDDRVIEIWYDKPNETDVDFSWIGLSKELVNCNQEAIDFSPYPKVLALMEYARPDVVLSANGIPFLAIESTQMNPSGHNLPQRFSCLVRSAEVGVPSIFYYLERARRSKSDPNPRNVNIRVPLGQLMLSHLYDVPSMSVIWPTDPKTLQAQAGLDAHIELARVVDEAVVLAKKGDMLENSSKVVQEKFQDMHRLINQYHGNTYHKNPSYTSIFEIEKCITLDFCSKSLVPPESCSLIDTNQLLKHLYKEFAGKASVPENKKTSQLQSRALSLVYNGTANKKKDGPEHPYPGYLTLIDIIYARTGMTTRERRHNLVFKLPIALSIFKDKAIDRQTGLNILMEFSDLIILDDAVIVGGWLRNLSAGAVLVKAK